jgi:hypothetical protein
MTLCLRQQDCPVASIPNPSKLLGRMKNSATILQVQHSVFAKRLVRCANQLKLLLDADKTDLTQITPNCPAVDIIS